MRVRNALPLIALAAVVGCRRGPIDATAALPVPGTTLPAFAVPRVDGGGSVTSAMLRGRPAVVALWSTHCPFQRSAMAALDSLAREFAARGVRFVVLADDGPGAALDSVLRAAPWRAAAHEIGVADGTLARLFDRSDAAAGRRDVRVEFVLPSFLLVDGNGRVVRRAFGPARETFRPALDSLLARTGAPTA